MTIRDRITVGCAARKSVAIVQSSYIPWKGYFDLINSVDEFVMFDDAQYTHRSWRNRNTIKTPRGPMWLTIPVVSSNRRFQKIRETVISDPGWNSRHWKSICHNYSRAKYFGSYKGRFENLYAGLSEEFLSQVNYRLITAICDILGITTKLSWSMDYDLVDGKTERLVHLCKQVGATEYVSGPTAKSYIDERLFERERISVRYMEYSEYPAYTQRFPPFEHRVSIIDLIFNTGPHATKYMGSF